MKYNLTLVVDGKYCSLDVSILILSTHTLDLSVSVWRSTIQYTSTVDCNALQYKELQVATCSDDAES